MEVGQRLNLRGLRLQPFVDLSATYDSNVELGSAGSSDYYTDALLGLDLARKSQWLSLQSQLWAKRVRYGSFKNKDNDGLSEYLTLAYQPVERVELTVNQRWAQLTDYAYDTLYSRTGLISPLDKTERNQRVIFSFDSGARWPVSDKIDMTLNYAYGSVNYENETSFDSVEHDLEANLFYNVTDKTSVFIYGAYEYIDSDGNQNVTHVYSLRGGANLVATDKSTIRSGVGVMTSQVDTPDGTGTAMDTSFNFYLSAKWKVSEKTTVFASARNYMKPTSDAQNNAMQSNEFSLSTNYNITDAYKVNVTGAYALNRYVNQVNYGGESIDQETKLWLFRARLTYTPPMNYFSLYIEGRLNYVVDNVSTGYEQYLVTGGLKFWY